MSVHLGFNTHGKGRVRLVKVTRNRDGTQDIIQFSVQVLLEGDIMDSAFLTGDNKNVVPTDTCKNTVYCVANKHEFRSAEEFGILLVRHFLTEYPEIVNKISVRVIRDRWERLTAPNSKGKMVPHQHVFKRTGPCKPYAHVQGEKRKGSSMKINLQAGFRNLDIVKTTQSGFVDFHKDKFTSLPEVTDRLLGTSVDAEWSFSDAAIARGNLDFNKIATNVENAMIHVFAGPSDKGVYSKSVQQTLYQMAGAALKAEGALSEITLEMPNIHNLPFPLERYGMKNADHTGNPTIFYPIDEPHGMIKATVSRTPSKL